MHKNSDNKYIMRLIITFNNKNVVLPEPWIPSGPPNDEIWYTSSDGNIVKPYLVSSLPTIVSNTYVDGKGVIKFETDVTSIGDDAFRRRGSLTSVTIPNSVTSIGYRAFSGCTSLTSVTIPDSVISIGEYALYGCSSLTSITIPNSVTSIGKYTFCSCSSLTSITIPNSVTSIRGSTFSYCSSLTYITIPDSVTSIGDSAFAVCISLSSISYTGTIDQYKAIAKGNRWNNDVPATVVHCTDGDTSIWN